MSFIRPDRRRLVWGAALVLAIWPSRVRAHPIHTTLTELRYDPARHTVEISIRLFAQDVLDALKRRDVTAGAGLDARASSYALSLFAVYDQGRAVTLESCGVKQTGDLLWLCLSAQRPPGLNDLTVSNRLLFELFDDQVNIVQATSEGRRLSLLFTKGDGAKRLQ